MEGKSFRCFMLVAVLALVVPYWAVAEIQCNDAVARVLPCESYLFSGDATPNTGCCSAVESLDKIAMTSQEDRRQICRCLKDAASSFPINLAKAQQLPKLCHVTLNVAISADVNCNSI